MNVRYVKGDLFIDKTEALKYIGYKNSIIDKETNKLLNKSIDELNKIIEPKYIYEIFDIKKNCNNTIFENLINIKSIDLVNLFVNCEKAAVLAATIGFEVEKRINYYSMNNLSKALVFDACAAACIESLCNIAENEIKEIAADEGCSITYRYSPGYGDLSISHQGEILSALKAHKLIGLTCLDTSILIPRKSVTAFIGFDKSKKIHEKSCLNCKLFGNCNFSKGEKCYDK